MPRQIPTANVRHDIDPLLVAAQIEQKIQKYKSDCESHRKRAIEHLAQYEDDMANNRSNRWARKPESPESVVEMFNDWIERESTYYATVRVIERPIKTKPFILVYGDEDDATVSTGTGGFSSFEEASEWFLQSGR